jgi:ABC-type sugar transport system ATPase subunit
LISRVFWQEVKKLEHSAEILKIGHVSKDFPGVKALDDVSMTFYKSEVVALLGENGAGKSTLMKILSGAYVRDKGEIVLDGYMLPRQFTTLEARHYGIAIIYQELSLMNELTVMENIYISHEPQKIKGVIDFRKMQADSEAILQKLNAGYISAKDTVGSLPLPQKQLVEIAKALALDCKVLIMDEPTTSLTTEEASNLFKVIEMLRAQSITVIYISHRLHEIFQMCDRAIVMRDGRVMGSRSIAESAQDEIIAMMSGKLLNLDYVRGEHLSYESRSIALELAGISDNMFIENLNLKVYEGEVLGIGGLIGSKRTELFRMVCGIDKMAAGTISMRGKEINIASPDAAIRHGIGYLSENRKEDGLSLGMTVEENTIHCDFSPVSKGGIVNWKKVRSLAESYIQKFKTKGTPAMLVMNLSGGNQQKVSITKWLHAGCNLLVFDEPTRGIDVASKAEIHQLIRDFARQPGNAAVVISSEVNELLAVSDRVVIMSKGKIISELTGPEIEQGNLTRHITMRSR